MNGYTAIVNNDTLLIIITTCNSRIRNISNSQHLILELVKVTITFNMVHIINHNFIKSQVTILKATGMNRNNSTPFFVYRYIT